MNIFLFVAAPSIANWFFPPTAVGDIVTIAQFTYVCVVTAIMLVCLTVVKVNTMRVMNSLAKFENKKVCEVYGKEVCNIVAPFVLLVISYSYLFIDMMTITTKKAKLGRITGSGIVSALPLVYIMLMHFYNF